MRAMSKPNCRTGQLGSWAISITNRCQELITHVFMMNDFAAESTTGAVQYTGDTLAMTLALGCGDV